MYPTQKDYTAAENSARGVFNTQGGMHTQAQTVCAIRHHRGRDPYVRDIESRAIGIRTTGGRS